MQEIQAADAADPQTRSPTQGPALRIAMVTETYPPEVNGVATSVARIVTGMRNNGHAVQLIRPRQNRETTGSTRGDVEEILTAGAPIPMYGQLRMGLPASDRLARDWTLRRPDIVHIATEGPLGWSALQTARKLRLPVCSEFRTNFQAYGRFYGIGWLQRPILSYLRGFHNRCDCTMVPTHALQHQLAASGFQSLEIVARGVDTRLYSPVKRSAALRQQWGVYDSDLVVLHVGRLAPEKNLGVVLQAFESIKNVKPRARLVFVGDGPSRRSLQARCPEAIFAGFRGGEELAAYYASSDMFLFPSLTETYGNVTLEAMASGLALVAFDDAAAGQLIRHGCNGMLAPKDDVAHFLQCATDLSANPQWRRNMGADARSQVSSLGWDAIMRKIEQLYVRAIKRAGTTRVRCAANPADAVNSIALAQTQQPGRPVR